MKIVALMGSARKKGNTDLLVDAFFQGAQSQGAEVKKLYLNGMALHGCRACLACHKTGKCKQKDDMHLIHEQLLQAELWLFATPVYWWGPTAQIKMVIDRFYSLCYSPDFPSIKGRLAVLVTASADPVKLATPHLFGMLRESCKFLKMKWAGEIAVQAGAKGEVANKPAELARARKLGAKLAVKK